MADSALKRESLADKAAEAILKLIVDGEMGAGDDLPSTAELSERFGVSRTVIREALAELAGRGIVARSQGRESVVAAPGARQIRQVMSFHIGHEDVDVHALMEFRRTIERDAAKLAAERATPDDLARMHATIDQQAASASEVAFQETDYEFHREIALATRNPLFVLVIDAVGGLLHEGQRLSYRGRTGRGSSLEAAVEEHRRILDAVERGSADDAAEAMSSHLAQTLDDIRASS